MLASVYEYIAGQIASSFEFHDFCINEKLFFSIFYGYILHPVVRERDNVIIILDFVMFMRYVAFW